MSETAKTFTIIKTVPSTVLFYLSPISNQSLRKEIYLTNQMPRQSLPLDWALGIFLDNSLYKMYKDGVFTFSDNKGIIQAAKEVFLHSSALEGVLLPLPEGAEKND